MDEISKFYRRDSDKVQHDIEREQKAEAKTYPISTSLEIHEQEEKKSVSRQNRLEFFIDIRNIL